MVTGEIKNSIDKIWNIFWSGGITNPMTVVEQFTYLLFIKSLDDKQIKSEKESKYFEFEPKIIFDKEHNELRWSVFRGYDAEEMYRIVSKKVFPFIKQMQSDEDSSFSKFMKDAIFIIPTPRMLEMLVTNIDELMSKVSFADLGDLYEYILSHLNTSGTIGQFRTPRHIINMIVEMVEPKPEDILIDPSVGTSGFLVSVAEYLKKNYEKEIFTSDF